MIQLVILLLLFSCTTESSSATKKWMAPDGKVKVLSTIAMIDDLVKKVGGQDVDSLTLIRGELDPHSYQLVKGDDEKFAHADLIFYNGLGLEHGPSLQSILKGNKKAIGLGNRLLQQYPKRILYHEGQLDPHIWMDISLWSETLPYIVEALSAKKPESAPLFERNAAELKREMQEAHQMVLDEMLAVPVGKRYLVSSHDAFQYFVCVYMATDEERSAGTWLPRVAAPEGLAPESQLSVTDIQALIEHVALYHIEVLFPESNVSKDSIRKIVSAAKERGLNIRMASEVLYADAMGPPGSDYLHMIRYDGKTIAKNLK